MTATAFRLYERFSVSSLLQLNGVRGRPSRPPRPRWPRPAGGAAAGGSAGAAGAAAGASAQVALHVTGSPVSGLTPLFDGPRQQYAVDLVIVHDQ